MAEQQYLGSQEHFEDSINEHYDQMEEMAKQQEKGMMDEIYKDMQPTLPDELDKEAQSLVDMFYEKMAFQSTELRRHEIAKQCAIIHVQGLIDENDSMFKMAELHMDARAIIVLSERLSQLNTLKQKIEAL